jgi:hypothetical protein
VANSVTWQLKHVVLKANMRSVQSRASSRRSGKCRTPLAGLSGLGDEYRGMAPGTILNNVSNEYMVLGVNMAAGFQVTDRLSAGAALTLGTGFEQLGFIGPLSASAMVHDYALRGTLGLDYDLTPCNTVGFDKGVLLAHFGPIARVGPDAAGPVDPVGRTRQMAIDPREKCSQLGGRLGTELGTRPIGIEIVGRQVSGQCSPHPGYRLRSLSRSCRIGTRDWGGRDP